MATNIKDFIDERLNNPRTPGTDIDMEKNTSNNNTVEQEDDIEHELTEVRSGDRDELRRIATQLTRQNTFTSIPADDHGISRQDTIAGLTFEDPTVDPTSATFSPYKWARLMIRELEAAKIKLPRAGITFKNMNVSGSGSALRLQTTVSDVLMAPLRAREFFAKGQEKKILNSFNGVVKSGELLVVLGRPGAGCSTFLKTISGELHGLDLDPQSVIHYNGIPQPTMMKNFRGEISYNRETDVHFPYLTVGETLRFAAAVRTPRVRALDIPRAQWVDTITQVFAAIFGLSHTLNTRVGSDNVRGVSGGERKRVSIAEMALAGAPIGTWDNSTRGLDAATALEFVRSLKMSANMLHNCHAVAIYQASQAIYDEFDKATVLYEGRQIYYGKASEAKKYFEDMGWACPARQTVPDFLTAITNPTERKAKAGFENKVPRTPEEFEKYWKASPLYASCLREIEEHEKEYPMEGRTLKEFRDGMVQAQAKHVKPESPYRISIPMQIKLNMIRSYQRIWGEKAATVTKIIGQVVLALIIGSIYYNTPHNTSAFFNKGAVIFFAVLLNSLLAITEINTQFAQRPIVEKQASYAFYYPFTENLAGYIADIPIKFIIAVCFNVILYFLASLRYEASNFFIYFLFTFVGQLTMSAIFRSIAAWSRTISQALSLAGVLVLALVIYTGFTIPSPYMHPWFKWITRINPVSYAFEALLVNEMHGRKFPCATPIPAYPGLTGPTFTCPVPGAVAGREFVLGDDWYSAAYEYSYSHLWRNFGIMCAFLVFFLALYLAGSNSATSSSAEVLVFRRGHVPKHISEAGKGKQSTDEEVVSPSTTVAAGSEQDEGLQAIPPQRDIFTWKNVTYDIKIKGEPRRLLSHVSGYVKPGTLTALMGVSGAGKTTLLDVLAQRTTVGVVHGDMLVSGQPLDSSFQRKTGYVQQQDLHLEYSTVRESLRFSAMLRQPKNVSKADKYAYVEEVIKMLNMEEFAEAVVGVPGEGLNVEQRKLLTIGVELAAKPEILLFLDEPSSGLDSAASWAIISFMRKLADNGQAVLSTIHQPSSILFQQFDRLLFLAKGGKTVYFGNIGENSKTLLDYFEYNGARPCAPEENPAEYMLEMVGAGASGNSTQDWHEVWKNSAEAAQVEREIDEIHAETARNKANQKPVADSHSEFAAPFYMQLMQTTIRTFQSSWRSPEYIWGKMLLGIMSALFIGFSFFQSDNSQQGLQNVLFSIFMITSTLTSLVQQILPRFVTQRALYEVRERPSKAYSWKAFLLAQIIVEIPYHIFLGIVVFACFNYPVFGIQSSERQGLILLFTIQFYIFTSTFATMIIAGLPDSETAGSIATLMFSLCLTFCGVLAPPSTLPGFWHWLYRVSPQTYLIGGIAVTGLSGRPVECSKSELAIFQPPSGATCGAYMEKFIASYSSGKLLNPNATSDCSYCVQSLADQFLERSSIQYSDRWRDFGIGFAYIIFNIAATVGLYYMFRVRKWDFESIFRRKK